MWRKYLKKPETKEHDVKNLATEVFSNNNLFVCEANPPTKETIEKKKTHGILRYTKPINGLTKSLEILITNAVNYVEFRVIKFSQKDLDLIGLCFQKNTKIQHQLEVLSIHNLKDDHLISKQISLGIRNLTNLKSLNLTCMFNLPECLLLCRSLNFRNKFNLFLDEATVGEEKIAIHLCFLLSLEALDCLGLPEFDANYSNACFIKLGKQLEKINLNAKERDLFFDFNILRANRISDRNILGRKYIDSIVCKSNIICHPSAEFGQPLFCTEDMPFCEPLILSKTGNNFLIAKVFAQLKFLKD